MALEYELPTLQKFFEQVKFTTSRSCQCTRGTHRPHPDCTGNQIARLYSTRNSAKSKQTEMVTLICLVYKTFWSWQFIDENQSLMNNIHHVRSEVVINRSYIILNDHTSDALTSSTACTTKMNKKKNI